MISHARSAGLPGPKSTDSPATAFRDEMQHLQPGCCASDIQHGGSAILVDSTCRLPKLLSTFWLWIGIDVCCLFGTFPID